MIDLLFLSTVILTLVLINGFFVAAEFAIAAVPPTRMTQLAEAGSTAAQQVLRTLREPARMSGYLSTAQAGITLASLGLGMYGEHTVAELLVEPLAHWGQLGEALAHTVAAIIAVTLLTYFHVVLGEMVPKSLALQSAETAALRLIGAMLTVERLLKPLTAMLSWLGNRVLQLLGIPYNDSNLSQVTTEELQYIVEESSEGGMLKPTEQLYLENVIDFGERSVAQVMTPRTRIVAIPSDADLTAVLDLIAENRFSRYPVYDEDRDHMIGVLHVKDLARQIAKGAETIALATLVRELTIVPKTMSLEKMLELFRQGQGQIAVVIDEFGGTAGLVTLEDLAEEIVGEIRDEFDTEEIAPVTLLDDGRLRLRGDLLLDELYQLQKIDLQAEEADTIGGLIVARLGRLAQVGDSIEYNQLQLTVEGVDRLAIATVLLTLPATTMSYEESATQLLASQSA